MRSNTSSIVLSLAEYFRKRQDIAVVYLFGSHAEDATLPTSDIDIAVVYQPDKQPVDTYAAQIKLIADLTALLHHPDIDIHILTPNSGLPFVNQILQHGQRIIINNQESAAQFEAQMYVRYIDFQPVHHQYIQEMEERLRRGTYGHR